MQQTRWLKIKNFLQRPLPKKSSAKKKSPLSTDLLSLFLFACGLFLLFAFFSYHQEDNSLKIVDDSDFHNWLGPVGAIIAESAFSLLGIFSFFIPLTLFYLCDRLVFLRLNFLSPLRIVGLLFISLGFMPLLCYLNSSIDNGFLWSGVLGLVIQKFLLIYVAKGGLFIIALTSISSGLLLLFGRSLLSAISLRTTKIILEKKPKPIKEEIIVEKLPILDEEINIIERDKKNVDYVVSKADQEKAQKEYAFSLPPLKLLDYDAPAISSIDQAQIKSEADKLQKAFLQFGIEGKIREIRPGPVVTNYEFVPAPGIKLSKIAALSDDIAMAMSAVQVRIVTPIPGKGAVGIELPNDKKETVFLKEIVADEKYRAQKHKLCMALGKDVEGNAFFMNLADMPHVLIAGSTGSGKSVSVNAMICSILYRATPNDVKFLMIDPKMLELSIYNGIPHLLLPPIIDAKKAANALRWATKEMDIRYSLMKELAVRDIGSYNEQIKEVDIDALPPVQGRKHEHLPFIVIVVDEYADLLAMAGKEVEAYVMRLAQKARAAGIHVMLATQRPSVDVITGVIKANFPVRMSFRLSSSHDSKTIINKTGAEKLLGRGDALIMPPGTSDVFRVHGAFISEKELMRVIEFLRTQKPPVYDEKIAEFAEEANVGTDHENTDAELDQKFNEAVAIVKEYKKCSTSFMQRQLSIGYNRAARIVEQMEKEGIVGPVLNARGEREIFIDFN